MKLISFFSKFTFICNISFVLFMIFNKIDAKKAVTGGRDTVAAIPFFKDLIIILGFSAIVINFLMCLVYLLLILAKKSAVIIPKWIAITNFIFLIVEFYFFFL